MSVASSLSSALPFFHLGSFDIPILNVPIQSFGVIVAGGVLIGAWLLRRYAEWHGVSDEHIRKLLGWVTICGFLGAHEFDMIAYNWDKIGEATNNIPPHWFSGYIPMPDALWPTNWPLPLRIWEGISSYGGFIGGAGGFAFYVWWKRLPTRLFADITIVGLLPAFSIGRIGCTVVSDHIGSAVDSAKWYAFLAEDYPRKLNMAHLAEHYPGTTEYIRAWNLGLIELLYLIPVNALILWLAFRPSKRMNGGFIVVLAGILYAPVRFGLDFLRPDETDPRYGGLTFAQWASILAFGAACYAASKIMKTGEPAEVVATTSGDAQRQLKMILREDDEVAAKADAKADLPKATAKDSDAPVSKDSGRAAADEKAAANKSADDDDDEADDDGDEGDDKADAAASKSGAAGAKPVAAKPGAPKRTRGKRGGKAARKR
jgi:phosphatidylglycerol---prolipoprotein diacylglyceryl transferase